MKIRNAILKALIFCVAILPFSLLYIVSDVLGFIIGKVIRYGCAVVLQNLRKSFPQKSKQEIYMIDQRQKYKGTLMIDYQKVFSTLVSLKDKLITVFVLADQSPPKSEMNYFMEFMGQKTAFSEGMEKVARALNYTVLYLDVQRAKRGCYEVEVELISLESKLTKQDFITTSYVSMLEESIRNQPDNWLWSHRRWKKREENQN